MIAIGAAPATLVRLPCALLYRWLLIVSVLLVTTALSVTPFADATGLSADGAQVNVFSSEVGREGAGSEGALLVRSAELATEVSPSPSRPLAHLPIEFAYDPPAAGHLDASVLKTTKASFPQVIAGESESTSPAAGVAGASTTPAVLTYTPSGAPARFIDSGGTIIDRMSIRATVSAQRQGRHVLGDRLYSGGGYFRDAGSPQGVLDAFHDGSAQVLGVTRNGHVVVRVPSVTGFNNNPAAGYVDQATNVFFIKGSSSPSVVPTNPNWAP